MYLIKKKTTIIALVVLLAILVSAITLTQVIDTASAATIESYDDLDFKLVTNSDGSQSYSVSLKVAYRKTAEFVVVPKTYNDLPVTEVASSGFMSCTKLTKVILPKSVVTLGRNAFMNCSNLEHITMPGVETIGDSAFSMCTKLERLYFPMSVKSVGTSILRNNSNTIYLQGSQEEIDRWWSSSWNSYFTGKTIEKVEPSDMIEYREILGMDQKTVVGYEIPEGQELPGGDIVIYNMYKLSDDAEYLPVLNICSEAFSGTGCDTLTIKDRHEDDPTAPEFTHKINIRSNAFLLAIIDEVNIQVGVTFNHPQGLVQEPEFSMLDDELITGDINGHSTRVFEESVIQSITLPADIDIITERMFKNCVFLESIKINGEEYDGTNVLPNVEFIGTRAFEYCISLENLTISDSVTYFGHNVFDGWGVNVTYQELNIDFYEGFVPGEADWSATGEKDLADIDTVHIIYREPTTIYVALQDGTGKTIELKVKPGLEMPELPEITRRGYEFNGIYSGENGSGFQYYTNSKEVAKLWKEGDSNKLYVNWKILYYEIEYDLSDVSIDVDISMNPTSYTVEDGEVIFQKPQVDNYVFWWEPESKPQDFLGKFTAVLHCAPIEYTIYYILDGGTNPEGNPSRIDVTETIVLQDPVKSEYKFIGWKLDGEFVTVLENIDRDITLEAVWIRRVFTIEYILNGGTNHEGNPDKIDLEETIVLQDPVRSEYRFIGWKLDGEYVTVLENIDRDITLEAIWERRVFAIKYVLNGGTNHEENPNKIDIEETIVLQNPVKSEYKFIGWKLDGEFVTVLENIDRDITLEAVWIRRVFTITYVMNGGTNHEGNPDKIDIEETVVLQDPVKKGYVFIGWKLDGKYVTVLENIDRDITLEAIWEPLGLGTTIIPTQDVTTIDNQRVIIDLTNASYIFNCKLIVSSTVEELVIYSNKPIDYYMSIVVNERQSNILIKLINVSLHGTGYCDTITVKSDVKLHLYAINSSVYGQEGARGVDGMLGMGMSGYGGSGEVGGKGYAAIKCYTLVIHTSVTIYGGTGGVGGTGATAMYPGDGGRGGIGGYAVDAQEIIVLADDVKLVGGDGGRGGRGALDGTGTRASNGGKGGAGSEATNATISGPYVPKLVTGQQGAQGEKGSWGPVHYGLDETNSI